jgi:uncharacterized protein
MRLGRPHPPASRIRRGIDARAIVFLLALLLCPALALAQAFPALTGRVVDAANLLKPEERAALEDKLKAHEDKTSDQIVVATVPSLEGFAIEDYANRLFRHWQLGQKKTNNGVLLLVAPQERKVRIEVGYGLEGTLTDALAKIIITTAIAPQFKSGDFAGGIDAGVDAVLSILTGDAEEWQRRVEVREDDSSAIDPIFAVFGLVMLFLMIVHLMAWINGRPYGARRQWSRVVTTGGGGWSSGSGSSWSGGSSGSSFSGGGGSSGGGGASGSW